MIKVYIKYHDKNLDKIEAHGCWIDLRSSKSYNIPNGQSKLIDLGVSMKLPKYFQACIVPRSSTFKNYGLIMLNHMGIIDGGDKESDGYSGNNDKWYFNGFALTSFAKISKNDRICQFEIRPSMFAPWYIKLKWLLNNKIKFIEVDDLKSSDRGGFGTTGKN